MWGAQKESRVALIAHETHFHGTLRAMRRKIVDETCLCCLRRFSSRAQCLDHIAKSKICEVNLLSFYDDRDDALVAAADLAQQAAAAEALKRGEWHSYTGMLVRQENGPLRRFIIPTDHSRKSRYKLFQKYLGDRFATVGVDFEMVWAAMYSEAGGEEAADLLPLAVLQFRQDTFA